MRKYGPQQGAIASVIVSCIGAHFFPQASIHFYAVFAIGVFGSWLLTTPQPDLPSPKFFGAMALTILIASLGIALMGNLDAFETNRPIYSIIWSGLALCTFLWIKSDEGKQVRAFLTSTRVRLLGAISYSLYLTHFPILSIGTYFLVPHIGKFATALVLVAVGVPLSLLFARGFWYLFERPYLESRRRKAAISRNVGAEISPKPSSIDLGSTEESQKYSDPAQATV
jgi:peptidoglycan/LPS O-acetylase OafA/YrhL